MIQFYSTNGRAPDVTLREALLTGQAPDKGLYMPREIPRVPREEIVAFRDKSYPEIAHAVLRRYTEGLIPDDELRRLCAECYDFEVPLERVHGNNWLMRLDRGPTASFKDFGARMMARMMRHFLAEEGGELVILTATSGDTGSAVAHAFHNVERISMVVLFPVKEVSARQRKQMTTLGGNVRVIGIDGKFDDCQALVKQAFADPELGRIRFSSANSINIGRLLPQSVYYFYAWARLQAGDAEAVFSVPSGNFGDMCGGMLARRMGLPVSRFVIATNENDEFPKFLAEERYRKVEPSRVCISNAMNVGHPSNLPRLVALYGGQMDETGAVSRPPDFAAMRRDIYALAVDDEATRRAIVETWREHKAMLEPHGAVGWAGLERYLKESDQVTRWLGGQVEGTTALGHSPLCISIETAHPAKFPEEITRLLGIEPALPPALADLDAREEQYDNGPNEYGWFRSRLQELFR
ncbi:MAG TPA: threonine synthase [candidate division WOR-3 bacterium]|uniref:Threonine synthase n=1 Tax=candidate division WOR-3 bacterium TaxID=2052148 RepID=A0A7V0T7V7_UNCW3|nr:threonine synthase [candidate division WOR-3 bacterium]